MIRGVLFDMDGVLVDSEAFICRAAILMFSELGTKVTPTTSFPSQGWAKTGTLEVWQKNII